MGRWTRWTTAELLAFEAEWTAEVRARRERRRDTTALDAQIRALQAEITRRANGALALEEGE